MSLDLDEIIKALAHPVRREILHWLKDPTVEFPDQLIAMSTASVPGRSTNAAACRSRPCPPTSPPCNAQA